MRIMSQWLVTYMFMVEEHKHSLLGNARDGTVPPIQGRKAGLAAMRLGGSVRRSVSCVRLVWGLCAVMRRSVVGSLLCDVAGGAAAWDMPKVRNGWPQVRSTMDHANALAAAAEKVGPQAVEADDGLVKRLVRCCQVVSVGWCGTGRTGNLIEQGVDPLERQRLAREVKLWGEKGAGLGVLGAKLPCPQFEQVRQAIDRHYLHHRHQDPNRVRDPKTRTADAVLTGGTGCPVTRLGVVLSRVGDDPGGRPPMRLGAPGGEASPTQ